MRDEHWNPVASILSDGFPTDHAALIATAPTLLLAVRAAIKFLEEIQQAGGDAVADQVFEATESLLGVLATLEENGYKGIAGY